MGCYIQVLMILLAHFFLTVAEGSADGTVKQWSVASGVELDSFNIGHGTNLEVSIPPMAAFVSILQVTAVACSEGQLLVCKEDGGIESHPVQRSLQLPDISQQIDATPAPQMKLSAEVSCSALREQG